MTTKALKGFLGGESKELSGLYLAAILFSLVAALFQTFSFPYAAPLLDDIDYMRMAFKMVDIQVFTKDGLWILPLNW